MQEEVTQKTIILQSKSQLKAIYKDNADTIEGNCDTTLFLGGKEKTTLKELAEVLGKETIEPVLRSELPKDRKRAYESGRDCSHGWR